MEIIMAVCNYVVTILYLIIFILALGVYQEENFKDLSIYTQASKDWTQNAWKDFVWADGLNCPAGYDYVDMSNVWHGTVEGNYTKNGSGVEPTDERW